jgi:RNA polymerase primary sigma factor
LLQEQLHSVLGTLSERKAGVVSMHFGFTDGQPETVDEIGKVYGATRERGCSARRRRPADQAGWA